MVKYYYDAWGFPFMDCDTNYRVNLGNGRVYHGGQIMSFNRFHYRSYFFDYDTGLYYLKSRFYDPKAHRFLSPDDADYLKTKIANNSIEGKTIEDWVKYGINLLFK